MNKDNGIIRRIEIEGAFKITVENDVDSCESIMGLNDWEIMFRSKQSVEDLIGLLQEGLSFWAYD